MRKRNVDKHIWFDRQEAQDLQKKASLPDRSGADPPANSWL